MEYELEGFTITAELGYCSGGPGLPPTHWVDLRNPKLTDEAAFRAEYECEPTTENMLEIAMRREDEIADDVYEHAKDCY